MRSLPAVWRVSLARTRADWPIVGAAWLITLLAAVLFSAGLIYPSAAAEAGLRRALDDAAPGTTNIDASMYAAPDIALDLDGKAYPELLGSLSKVGGTVVRDWRSSATLALGGLPGSADGDQAVVGFLEGLAEHATLVEGAWPADRASESDPIEVVLVDRAAGDLGLGVGDRIDMVAHPSTTAVALPARLVGIFTPTSAADPFWDRDVQLLDGLRENAQYRTFGPFLTTRDDLLSAGGVDELRLQWRTFPDFDRLQVDDAARFRAGVEGLRERLGMATGEAVQVSTGLGDLLRGTERSLLVTRTSVLLVMAQMALLAAYAIVLTASLLVDHRRIDTAMLRSRGAGAADVALLALVEGLLLAIPAVLVAPWLAVAALEAFNVVGPLADVGLRIVPRVTLDAYAAAAAAGIVCVALLVLPAALSARRFAAERGGLSRQETRTLGQRVGLDVAFLAVTAIALWQLRLYGAPLTRSVQGSLGMDPLLVAAPAIALIAGAVLALRVLPLLAQALEAAVSRGRSLVASLGSRQLARRPLRYTRSALLLILAMSMGVFALSYASTWGSSQRDQAAYQSGADVRLLPRDLPGGLPASTIAAGVAALDSVEATAAVERLPKGIDFPLGGSVDVLAIDAEAATGVVLARGDEAAIPLDALLDPLRAGRPDPALAALPAGTTLLRLVPLVEIRSISRFTFDPETGNTASIPLDPATIEGVRVNASAILRDAHGLLFAVSSPVVPYTGPEMHFELPLQAADGPMELAALGVEVWLPADTFTGDGDFGVARVTAASDPAGPWANVPLAEATEPWAAKLAGGRDTLVPVPASAVRDATVTLAGEGESGSVFGRGGQGPAAVLSFLPRLLADTRDAVPVIANRALIDSLEAATGDEVTADLAGRVRRFTITGVVETFPTTDPSIPLVVMDQATLAMLRLGGTSTTRAPDEWWLAASGGDVERLAADVRAGPGQTADVASVMDRTRSLSTDPVALGIIGALTLGFVATGLFAIVGLTVSTAVGARQRRTEFALLRALGLSGRQLASSLWLENGSLVVVSLIAGTSLGLLIGWLVLPFVTVTQQATAPVPSVIVHVPWDRILLLDAISAVALGLAVIVIGGVLRRIGVGSVLRMGED